MTFRKPAYPLRATLPLLLLAVAVLIAIQVSTNAADTPSQLTLYPEQIDLHGPGSQHGLLVAADSHDITRQVHLTSSNPAIAIITPDGQIQAVSDGQAEISVDYKGTIAHLPITISDAAKPRIPSFRQDVMPILTSTGCNSGGCHGKVAGQNGFKLSLRGYAPEQDYLALTAELDSRRINFAAPAESLFVQKPLGKVPHEGGVRLSENSRAHKQLLRWIEARSPSPDPAESDSTSLEVLPGDRTLHVAETQQLLVRAHYPDDTVRDVTWLCQFFSNDDNVITVTREGVVKSIRPGTTSVRAHFQGQVGVVTFTTAFENQVDSAAFAGKKNLIDEPVFHQLELLHLPPSPPCDDATFLRRSFLDVTGTLPSPEEAVAFLADTNPDKRSKLIDALLERPEYVDHWTLQLCDIFQNRRERDHDARGAKGVRSFQAWLRQQVAANRHWDDLTRDVLLAKGDTVHQPQVGYFVAPISEKQNVEESDLGDSVAMAFLGSRIGCARCHNHPLEKYTQDDYYHFAAFFSRVVMKRPNGDTGGPTTLAVSSRDEDQIDRQISETGRNLIDATSTAAAEKDEEARKAGAKVEEFERRLLDLNNQLAEAHKRLPGVGQPRTGKTMAPQQLDGTKVEWSPGQDPRESLVAWMTNPKNENFSGNMVNRLWKHFMGVGLVEQVDDLRSSNPPSNPQLWKALNQEFVTHQFDLKHVMRLILNSRTYQLSSDTLAQNEQDHRFYSHYFARRLPAEALSDAISAATRVPDEYSGYPVGERAVQLPEPGINSYFLTLFGRSERVTACACERNGDVTLPQLLHLGNGSELMKKVRANEGRLTALLAAEKDDAAVTKTLFLATLSRPPTEKEFEAVKHALAEGDPRDETFRDLFWALMNSKEFTFNH